MAKSPATRAAAAAAARDRALQTTPAAVRAAFTATGEYVGALHLRPLTVGTQMVLERIEHPFTDPTFIASPRTPTSREIARAIFVLSHTAVECEELLDRGLPVFDRAVIEQMDTIPIGDQRELGAKLQQVLASSLITLIAGRGASKGGADPLPVSPATTPGAAGNSR
jgi:hypothetical protein